MQFYTTNTNRTISSATSQLFGIYPLGQGPILPQIDQKYYIPPYSYSKDSSDHNFALPLGYLPIPTTFNESVLILSCPLQSI